MTLFGRDQREGSPAPTGPLPTSTNSAGPPAAAEVPGGLDRLLEEASRAPEAAAPETAGAVDPRLDRLAGAVGGSKRRGGRDVRKMMNALGMVAIGFGIATVILGWYGASHSPYLYQEIPYLISGGLLGLALVFGGGVLVLSGWSLRQIHEARRDTQAIVRALDRIERGLRTATPASVAADPPADAHALTNGGAR